MGGVGGGGGVISIKRNVGGGLPGRGGGGYIKRKVGVPGVGLYQSPNANNSTYITLIFFILVNLGSFFPNNKKNIKMWIIKKKELEGLPTRNPLHILIQHMTKHAYCNIGMSGARGRGV